MKQYLAVDIGGTSMKYAAVDDRGELRRLGTVPTGSGMTRAGLETALLQAARAVQGPLDGVGISTLGTVNSAAGRVLGGVENMPCLQDFCPAGLFAREWPGLPVNILNDVRAAALGEMWRGAAQGKRDFLCVAFGTGVGGCVVLNGRPLEGAFHRAGEIGYWNYAGPEEYWELQGSAVALIRRGAAALNCPDLDGRAFFARLEEGDPVCEALFADWLQKAGRVFANIQILLDLDTIVVGGGVSAQKERLTEPLRRAMEECLPPECRDRCRVVPALLGNDAALLGSVCGLLGRKVG